VDGREVAPGFVVGQCAGFFGASICPRLPPSTVGVGRSKVGREPAPILMVVQDLYVPPSVHSHPLSSPSLVIHGSLV